MEGYEKLVTEGAVDGATLAYWDSVDVIKEFEMDDVKFKTAHARKLLGLVIKWKDEGVCRAVVLPC